RADTRDVLILRTGIETPALLATSSPRRRLQVKLLFPEVAFTEIRGNVDTRLRKIGELHVADGTILAAAGLARLGIDTWPGVDFLPLAFDQMAPAVGQGAIAIQCRDDESAKFAAVFDAATARTVTLERAFQAALGGGCHTAFAAHATFDTLYLFHENIGPRIVRLSPDDLATPTATAARILAEAGLLP
ncbi:MAG: hypothetical protein RIQ93_1480, partial [Verrucomicrobiota bacterium]